MCWGLVRRADFVINSSEEDITQRVMDITGAAHAHDTALFSFRRTVCP
jgi:hypothetical protein